MVKIWNGLHSVFLVANYYTNYLQPSSILRASVLSYKFLKSGNLNLHFTYDSSAFYKHLTTIITYDLHAIFEHITYELLTIQVRFTSILL